MGTENIKYLLDTHTWIWWHISPEKIPPKIKKIISAPPGDGSLLLHTISVWEFCKLAERRRLVLSLNPEAWLEQALDMAGLFLVPLSPALALQSTRLPGALHSDPADQILTACARSFNAVLLTKDERLQKYPHIRTMWD